MNLYLSLAYLNLSKKKVNKGYTLLSNRPGAAWIGANVTGLDELQNANPGLNLVIGSFKVNTRDSNYVNLKTCIHV